MAEKKKLILQNEDEPIQPQPQKRLLQEEYSFRIKPKKIVKAAFIVLLLVAIFFAGRWSIGLADLMSNDSGITGAVTAEVETEEEVEDEAEPEEVDLKEVEVAEEVEAEPEVNEEPKEETIITEYKSVKLTLNNVKREWKGTWGKIGHVDYTIKNSEAGTIKPEYMVMRVQGYEDTQRKIPLPLSSKTIKSGKTTGLVLKMPKGFAYNEASLDDISKVRVFITLYDSQDKAITTATGTFNLAG